MSSFRVTATEIALAEQQRRIASSMIIFDDPEPDEYMPRVVSIWHDGGGPDLGVIRYQVGILIPKGRRWAPEGRRHRQRPILANGLTPRNKLLASARVWADRWRLPFEPNIQPGDAVGEQFLKQLAVALLRKAGT